MNKNYRNEVREKGEVMGFSWFPENWISLHPNVPFLFLAQSIIAWWYEKIRVFHQRFPDYGNLPSFTQISKRVSWMPKQMSEFTVPWEESLLSSPAGGGREGGREGLCTLQGSLLTLWVHQQSFGKRWYAGLYLAVGTARRSTKTPSYKQEMRHKVCLSQPAQQLGDCSLHQVTGKAVREYWCILQSVY